MRNNEERYNPKKSKRTFVIGGIGGFLVSVPVGVLFAYGVGLFCKCVVGFEPTYFVDFLGGALGLLLAILLEKYCLEKIQYINRYIKLNKLMMNEIERIKNMQIYEGNNKYCIDMDRNSNSDSDLITTTVTEVTVSEQPRSTESKVSEDKNTDTKSGSSANVRDSDCQTVDGKSNEKSSPKIVIESDKEFRTFYKISSQQYDSSSKDAKKVAMSSDEWKRMLAEKWADFMATQNVREFIFDDVVQSAEMMMVFIDLPCKDKYIKDLISQLCRVQKYIEILNKSAAEYEKLAAEYKELNAGYKSDNSSQKNGVMVDTNNLNNLAEKKSKIEKKMTDQKGETIRLWLRLRYEIQCVEQYHALE